MIAEQVSQHDIGRRVAENPLQSENESQPAISMVWALPQVTHIRVLGVQLFLVPGLINDDVRELRQLLDQVQYPALESAVGQASQDVRDAKFSLSHVGTSCRMEDAQNKHLGDTKSALRNPVPDLP
jgi:hypothetical protein